MFTLYRCSRILFVCIGLFLRFIISLRGINKILSIINRFFNKYIINRLFLKEELCPNIYNYAGSDEFNDNDENTKDSKSLNLPEG